jgi:hypothetical protein
MGADAVTPEMIDECLALIAIGEPVRKACVSAGLSAEQLYRRMLADEDLAQRYARAKEAALDAMADDILAIADDGVNDTYTDDDGNERTRVDVIARSRLRVDSRKWIMSKLAPKKWGDKITQELTGAEGAPLIPVLNVTIGQAGPVASPEAGAGSPNKRK